MGSRVSKRGTLLFAGAAALATAGAVRLLRTAKAMRSVPPELRSPLLYLDLSFIRPWMLPVVRPLYAADLPVVEGVRMHREPLTGHGDASVLVYEPAHRAAPGGGALLWIHGGGHVIGNAARDNTACSRLSRDLGVPVVSVDYRLAPFPTDLDDCMAALRWLHEHAEQLGVDPGRVAIGGGSAGAGLAAALAQRALDEHVPVAFQLLVYPMLDDLTGQAPDPHGRGTFVWTAALNRMAWTYYLGHRPTGEDPRSYAIAGARDDLHGLPPAWIGVGTLDLFHDEDLTYARRLQSAGVECEVHVEPSMYHGADFVSADAPSMQRFYQRMVDAVRPYVSGS